MSMTRNQLRQRIARNLGGGMVKTELCVEHLDDAINTARDLWITVAVGNATMEIYFLLMLKAGQRVYDMPAGLTDVVGYTDKMGGVGYGSGFDSFGGYGPARWYTGPEHGNTAFFALQNPDWAGLGYGGGMGMGMGMGMGGRGGGMYTMVDTYLAISNMELWRKMRHDKYHWRYHRFNNQIEILPTPECGNQLQVGIPPSGTICPYEYEDYELVDSPGYCMIRGFIMEGCSLPTYIPSVPTSGAAVDDEDITSMYPAADVNHLEYIYSHPWIIAYSTAYAKQTLGLIRRKFASNTSLGNASISLDGDSLVSEARDDMQRLEEELDKNWAYEGYGIYMG